MIISTPLGSYKGLTTPHGLIFKGIPFANVSQRFKPATPIKAHPTTYDATAYGPIAMQPTTSSHLPMSENCLNLNIWTPNIETLKPVVIQIHGGGFTAGTGADDLFNGESFIKTHDVVYVSLNYRLGVFGFLDVSPLLGPLYQPSGNLGILDLIEGLRFVHHYIQCFGGDPNRVTLMGESAGAKCVATLLTLQEARPYFNQAILQSGALQCIRDLPTAQAVTSDFLTQLAHLLDVPHLTHDELLTIDASVLLQAQQKMSSLHTFGPVFDHILLKTEPCTALAMLKKYPLRVLMGYNLNEAHLFLENNSPLLTKDYQTVNQLFGTNTAYILSQPGDWSAVLTQYLYQNATLQLAKWLVALEHEVYFYRFDYGRACHAFDLAFVFDAPIKNHPLHTFDLDGQSLATFMHTTWGDFITQASLSDWPCLTKTQQILILDRSLTVESFEVNKLDSCFPLQVFKR